MSTPLPFRCLVASLQPSSFTNTLHTLHPLHTSGDYNGSSRGNGTGRQRVNPLSEILEADALGTLPFSCLVLPRVV